MSRTTAAPQKSWGIGPHGGTSILCAIVVACAVRVCAQDASFQKTIHVYKTVENTRIEADVYRANDETVRPVVVWIHGGSLVNGTRTDAPRNLLDLCRSEGYALVSLDYRLAPEVKLPAIAEDMDDAFVWIREQGPALLHVDPDRCVITGGSAGAYLALLAGTRMKPRPRDSCPTGASPTSATSTAPASSRRNARIFRSCVKKTRTEAWAETC